MYLFVPKVNKTCENSFLSLPDLEAHILTSYSRKQRIVRHSKLRLSFLKVSFFSSKTCGVRQALSIKIVSRPFVRTPKQGFVVVQKKKSWLKFCFAEIEIERAERKTVWEFSFCHANKKQEVSDMSSNKTTW